MPIIRSSRVLRRWLLPVVFGALVFKLSVCVRFAGSSPQTGHIISKFCIFECVSRLIKVIVFYDFYVIVFY